MLNVITQYYFKSVLFQFTQFRDFFFTTCFYFHIKNFVIGVKHLKVKDGNTHNLFIDTKNKLILCQDKQFGKHGNTSNI